MCPGLICPSGSCNDVRPEGGGDSMAPGPEGGLQVGGGLDGAGHCMLQGSLAQVYQLSIALIQRILQLPAHNVPSLANSG